MNSVAVVCLAHDASLRDLLQEVAIAANVPFVSYCSPEELLQARRARRAAIAVLDMSLSSRTDVLRCVEQLSCHLRLVLLSGEPDVSFAVQATKLGCADVLLNNQDLRCRLEAHVLEEKALIEPTAALYEQLGSLSARERDVIKLMIEGASVKQVAVTLGISSKTASEHVSRTLEKMRVENPVQLLRRLCHRVSSGIDRRLQGWLSLNLTPEQSS